MRFFSNDECVINISNDPTDLSGRTSSVGVLLLHSTCQRNDNGIGAGLNIAAPCRRRSCERIRSPASYGFHTSIGRPDLTCGLVYFKDSFDDHGPLKEWVIPSKSDKPQETKDIEEGTFII
ncbi:hypothetical protein GJ496_008328 [Pomphorhynchus laevis]|nr:hypothetical protein GJ496_008328 [Pomphorhynchus laevis]